MKKYDEVSATRALENKGIIVDSVRKILTVPRKSPVIGNGTLGKIDFFRNHLNYFVYYADSMGKIASNGNVSKRPKVTREEKKSIKELVIKKAKK